jgi:hypothetical protein
MNPPDAHPMPRQRTRSSHWPRSPLAASDRHGPRGPSSDAVRQVNREAHFALDRITNAVLLLPSDSRSSDATHPPERSASTILPAKG